MFRLKNLLLLTFIVAVICMSGCGNNTNTGISKTGFFLDTVCTVTVYGIDEQNSYFDYDNEEEQEKQILQLITDAFKVCTEYENTLSKTISSSDVSKLNNSAGDSVAVSNTTVEVLEKGKEFGDISNGIFDISIGKATELWDFHVAEEESDAVGQVPNETDLKEAVSHVDYKNIVISGNTVMFKDPDMEIDLGGIAKGYIADRLTEYLQKFGVTSAIIDLGGNIVAVGGKTADITGDIKDDFTIGIKDPESDTGALLGIITCRDKTVVTSGTYERCFEYEDRIYHHILDPETGYPVDTDVVSATIISDKGNSADSDALSTICLAIGAEEAVKLAQSIEWAEVIIVDGSGKIYVSDENIAFEEYE